MRSGLEVCACINNFTSFSGVPRKWSDVLTGPFGGTCDRILWYHHSVEKSSSISFLSPHFFFLYKQESCVSPTSTCQKKGHLIFIIQPKKNHPDTPQPNTHSTLPSTTAEGGRGISPPLRSTMFTQGESVYVCRTTGGWSDAVVQGVDPVAQEVVVMFRDEKGRAMRKALTYAAAAVHLRRKDGGAGGGGVPGQDNSAPFPRADTASPLDLLPPQKRHAVVRLCDAMLAAPQQDTAATARQWLAEDVRDEATFTNVGVKRLGGFYEMVCWKCFGIMMPTSKWM